MKVQNIWGADMYRDGGPYGFLFSSDNGYRYEFFLQTRFLEQPRSQESHHPPVICLGSRNDDKPVQQLTWEEAKPSSHRCTLGGGASKMRGSASRSSLP